MAMGTRKRREKQEDLWIAHTELASAPGHPFYQRLNELLEAEGFDEFVEGRWGKFYAEKYGRPALTPGIYFRALLIGCPGAAANSVCAIHKPSCFSRCLRVPIAMRPFYKPPLWIP